MDEYLGRIAKRDVQMALPPADMAADFSRYLSAAISRGRGAGRRADPRDSRALYDLSSALGLQASWSATVEGRMGRAFGAARRAYKTAEQASALAPDDPDPRLILGTYRYVVSGMNLPTRMVAYMAGLDGDRARGLQMVEQAASSDSLVRTEARFALSSSTTGRRAGTMRSACWPHCAICIRATGCCGSRPAPPPCAPAVRPMPCGGSTMVSR